MFKNKGNKKMNDKQNTKLMNDLLQFLKVGFYAFSVGVLITSWLIHITK